MNKIITLIAFFGLAACNSETTQPQDQFFSHLSSLCGKAFAGKLVSDDTADADWRDKPMVMHVRQCTDNEIRIPLHVGEDRSRTWVITRSETSLTLKHDHRHEDGKEDALTQYGGTTVDNGTDTRQEFPADIFSKELFIREGIEVSTANVWAIDITPGEGFAYELSRPNRFFRAEFDLRQPVTIPPAPWGAEN